MATNHQTTKSEIKKIKRTPAEPTGRYVKMPDGSKHFVIDLGYKTNSVELIKEHRGRG